VKVLFLGPSGSPVVSDLRDAGCEIEIQEGPPLVTAEYDFLVSFGYRHIVPVSVLKVYGERAINLHISLLPWNRGADPNFWSFVEGTPKGVTIHAMDEGIDTGPIFAQERVAFAPGGTLRSTYARLQDGIRALFRRTWPDIVSGRLPPTPQPHRGTFHGVADKRALEHLLVDGWDTPVEVLERYGRDHGLVKTELNVS
jgi:methionyl-tRNA formyltransferase